jgi:translation elongation factor EF-1alpha
MPKITAKKDLRTIVGSGRFTKEEMRKINKKARKMGYTKSSFIRASVLDAIAEEGE